MVKITTQVQHVSADDLTREILEGVDEKIKALEQRLQHNDPPEFIDRKQVSILLGVSLVTIHDWCKKGILHPYRIGNRVRFKRQDIIDTLERSRNR